MEKLEKGNTAIIYLYDNNKIIKIFNDNFSLNTIKKEFNNSLLINKYVKNSIKAYSLEKINNSYGIIYEKVNGITLLDCFYKNDTSIDIIDLLVSEQLKVLNNIAHDAIDYKHFLKTDVKDQDLINKIDDLPNEEYLCHGDFHFGNVMIDNNKNLYIIDFMNVCKGPKEYDIARTYFLISKGNNPSSQEQFLFQENIAKQYLNKTGYTFQDIKKYLDVIELTRKYE